MKAVAGRERFESNADKLGWMQRGAARDVDLPAVQRWAEKFRPVVGRDPMAGARAIFRFVSICVIYVGDPGAELLDGSSVALARGIGDCDAKARLFVALCRACGLDAELEPVFRGDTFPHVRARVTVNGISYRADPTILNSDVGVPPQGRPITNY